jgi:RNA polymerase sigma factor (sigma-70 family)
MGLPAIESNGTSRDTEALYLEHGAAVARFCRSRLRDQSEAEDATQQVFLSAHRALLNGSAPREPLAWLLGVARHECYARFRQRRASLVAAGDVPDGTAPDASVHALRAGELATMWEEVSRMPSAQREAFLLREIRGLSYSQLAAELSLSAPSVRSLLGRARTRLRHRLRDVTAGLGGAPWIQTLARLVGGGDRASPLPGATKAAAVGIGALALVGGGDLARVQHHASSAPRHTASQHRAHARVRLAATSVADPVAPGEDRPGRDVRRSEPEHSRGSGDGSRESGSGRSGSSEDSGQSVTSSGSGVSGSGHDGSGDTTAVAQTSTDGPGGGDSSTSSSTSTSSGRDGSGGGSSDGGSSGSGSDDGSGSTTTTTTTITTSGSDGGGGSSGPGG